MEGQALIGMSNAEFDNLIERYLRRGEQEPRDLESGVFFDAVANFAAGPTETTIELTGEWRQGHLVLKPARPVPPDVIVRDNQISAPGFTFVIRINPAAPVTAG